MDAAIVALFNFEAQTIRLFGEVNQTIPFQNSFLLPILLQNKDVLYITSGDIVSAEEIIAHVENNTYSAEFEEKWFIHSTVDGYTKVADIGITFAGPRDAKPLDRLGIDVFSRSKNLRELLVQGKVEVINEESAKALKKPLPGKNMRDMALDKLLLKKSHTEALNDIEDIFSDENEVSPDEEVVSDAERAIQEGYGKRE